MRIALVGKGGVGKSALAATIARLLARRGRQVLAADLDTNPGLGYSLGLRTVEATLPPEAVEPAAGTSYGWRLASGLDPMDALERYSLVGPDGVRFLSVAKVHEDDTAAPARSYQAGNSVLHALDDKAWDLVGDLEAGSTTPFQGFHLFARRMLLVVNPSCSSALAGRRIRPLLGEVPLSVVANRWDGEPDHPGDPPIIRIPFDPRVAEAERAGLAPLDCCPDSPAIAAIEELVELLLKQEART